MGTLTAEEAQSRVQDYKDLLQNIIDSAQNNFEDMDFENANRRDEIEEIIGLIKKDCSDLQGALDELTFEE